MGGKTIKTKPGRPVRLHVQLPEDNVGKVIKADVFEHGKAETPLNGTPIILTHKSHGFYEDESFAMPFLSKVVGQYRIFEADGITPSLNSDQIVSDTFELDLIGIKPDIVVEVSKAAQIDVEVLKPVLIAVEVTPGD